MVFSNSHMRGRLGHLRVLKTESIQMGAAALSKLRAEDDPQDPLDLAEAMLIEGEPDFDRAIFRPVDLKQKPFWSSTRSIAGPP